MSRIGNKAITVPAGVSISNDHGVLTIKGGKGTLTHQLPKGIEAHLDGDSLTFTRINEEKHTKQLHGTTRALVAGMITGVTEGYTRKLVITGIGYRAAMEGDTLRMNLGYSHPKYVTALLGTKITVNSPTEVEVSGIDKQVVGQMAALIRACREPEPYKGKGIAYAGEKIRRKEGKKASKK